MKQTKECYWCGAEYEGEKSTSLFCSARCRVAHNRRNDSGRDATITRRTVWVNQHGQRTAEVFMMGKVRIVQDLDQSRVW